MGGPGGMPPFASRIGGCNNRMGTPSRRSPLFEIADVVVRLDYVAGGGVNSYLANQWLRIVPVSLLLGLDWSLTPPPPPLTSFTGSRSRISKSRILAFLSRRQTERTTTIFGDRSSITNY